MKTNSPFEVNSMSSIIFFNSGSPMKTVLNISDLQNAAKESHRNQSFLEEGVNDETLSGLAAGSVCTSEYQHSIKALLIALQTSDCL